MKVLLDTNVFIWMDTDMSRLSPAVLSYFNDPNCQIFLSVVSVWEIIIKVGIGKLALSGDVEQIIHDIQKRNPLLILPIEVPHAIEVRSLPPIHRDPFDRMLIAQARVENAVLLTSDPKLRQYSVQSDW